MMDSTKRHSAGVRLAPFERRVGVAEQVHALLVAFGKGLDQALERPVFGDPGEDELSLALGH